MQIKALSTGPFQINTWIVPLTQQKVLIIDPAACSFTNDQNKITDYLQKNNLEPLAILLTHGHFDHITGTKILKEKYSDVPLVCHKNDSQMAGANASQIQKEALSMMGLEVLCNALNNLPNPDITFDTDTTLYSLLLSNLKDKSEELTSQLKEWEIICTPGHTPGSVCFYNKKEKLLFSGDTIFYHSYGRTDLPGGNQKTIEQSLKKIYSTLPGDTLVYPGHDYAAFPLGENL